MFIMLSGSFMRYKLWMIIQHLYSLRVCFQYFKTIELQFRKVVWECFQLHWISYGESRISSPIQNSSGLVFMIGRIATFLLDFVMYEGMDLEFNKKHQTLYVPRCGSIDLCTLNSSIMILVKMYPSLKQNHWLGTLNFFSLILMLRGWYWWWKSQYTQWFDGM